jgi:hypothetical protein
VFVREDLNSHLAHVRNEGRHGAAISRKEFRYRFIELNALKRLYEFSNHFIFKSHDPFSHLSTPKHPMPSPLQRLRHRSLRRLRLFAG